MDKEIKNDLIWAGLPMAATLLLFGVLTGFKFGIYGFEVNDARLDMPVLEPFLLTYFWITLIAFTIREWQHKYERKRPVIIMMTLNSLTIITTILFLYSLLIASAVGGIIEMILSKSQTGEFQSPLMALLDSLKWFALILIPLLVFLEIWLIARLRKLSTAES